MPLVMLLPLLPGLLPLLIPSELSVRLPPPLLVLRVVTALVVTFLSTSRPAILLAPLVPLLMPTRSASYVPLPVPPAPLLPVPPISIT